MDVPSSDNTGMDKSERFVKKGCRALAGAFEPLTKGPSQSTNVNAVHEPELSSDLMKAVVALNHDPAAPFFGSAQHPEMHLPSLLNSMVRPLSGR